MISPDARAHRETFFKIIFPRHAIGYMCIGYILPGKRGLEEIFYKWPDQLDEAQDLIQARVMTHNIYFCPTLTQRKRRIKDSITISNCAWADLDTCLPENMLVRPSITLESSPGRYQALWIFADDQPAEEAEELNLRIAYFHARQGADRSGWDLTQLLRVPFTLNRKPEYDQGAASPEVKILEANPAKYRMSDFLKYPEAPDRKTSDQPFPESLPGLTADDAFNKYRQKVQPLARVIFDTEPEGSWSEQLWRLEMLCLEAGMSREETFIVARESQCNKYRRDNKPEEMLWKEVCRAYVRNERNISILLPTEDLEIAEVPLLTEKEREVVLQDESFVDRYIRWAKSLGDAAWQYHQAGAFITLSSLLAGNMQLPTSFGNIKPNMWFMILADSTITRKSTAMDIAIDLVEEIDSDIILATDGSIEGLMTSLSLRPGRPGIFLRDEFSGLLEQFAKRDYYAGMAETLTKLYDGRMQKRVLKKEIVEVRDPILILFAGGIKQKILGQLTAENVSSGFLPRFVFITAESDIKNVRPLGPPMPANVEAREAILKELRVLWEHYNVIDTFRLGDKGAVVGQKRHMWEVSMTPEAWTLYNRLEGDLVKAAMSAENFDIMSPTYDRLAKSGLKAATLLAAARVTRENVLVEGIDMLRAINYVEGWRTHTNIIIRGLGRGAEERELERVLSAITRKPGITRSSLMQTYHMNARRAGIIFDTLYQRGQIERTRQGRTEMLYPLASITNPPARAPK